MDNNIINTEEIMEEAVETVETNSRKALKVAAGAGAVLLVGGLIYKFIAKPLIAKRKAKKDKSDMIEVEAVDISDDEASNEDNQ
jgi:flagellar biosynthesis/type III secretory pathway M-ring protein FliF/YscJ